MNNYEFCAQWVLDRQPAQDDRVLDYGCGSGEIVRLLRAKGVMAFGCDVFYEGGDYSPRIDAELFVSGTIRRMEGGVIPFESDSFDYVVTNQVLEHVPDLDGVLDEIRRVLKPGGKVLSLFPDRGVWREGHSGVPFLHWFPKGSKNLRVYYAALFRSLGFGYFHNKKTVMRWSRDFCDWLDRWTYYLERRTIDAAYEARFVRLERLEDQWLRLRARHSTFRHLVAVTPKPCRELVVRKLAGLIFTAQK